MSVIKLCPKCGKCPNIGWMESFFLGAQPSGFAMCDCHTPVITPQEVDYFKIRDAWNARCDRLRMARKNGKSHMALGIDGIENEPSEKDGRIADKEEQP